MLYPICLRLGHCVAKLSVPQVALDLQEPAEHIAANFVRALMKRLKGGVRLIPLAAFDPRERAQRRTIGVAVGTIGDVTCHDLLLALLRQYSTFD